VLIPVLRPGHVRELPRDFMYAGLLYSLPLAAVAGASAFGWMVAYLRGPDIVADYISHYAGTDPAMIMFLLVVLFVIVGDLSTRCRRSSSSCRSSTSSPRSAASTRCTWAR
jgi:TRAP-type C4-dicarboxylate transport system permease large subunit